MATEPRPGTESPDSRDSGRQTSDPLAQRNGQGADKTSSPSPAQSSPDSGGRTDERNRGSGPARESDPAAGRDLPDENGEPPSVKRPGGNPEESEPPVENT